MKVRIRIHLAILDCATLLWRNVPLTVDGEQGPDRVLAREPRLEVVEWDELGAYLLDLGVFNLICVQIHYKLEIEFN